MHFAKSDGGKRDEHHVKTIEQRPSFNVVIAHAADKKDNEKNNSVEQNWP